MKISTPVVSKSLAKGLLLSLLVFTLPVSAERSLNPAYAAVNRIDAVQSACARCDTGSGNIAPTVELTSPTNGQSFTTGLRIDGRNFVWEVPNSCNAGLNGHCFNAFGRPTRVVRSGTP